LSLLAHPAVLRTGAGLPMPLCVTAFVPTASAMVWFLSLLITFRPPVSKSSLRHGTPAAVKHSPPHTTSILLTWTRVYGYKVHPKTGHEGRFTPGKHPISTVQEAVWAPGTVWTCAGKLAPTGIRSPARPSRSESLYRLNYEYQEYFLGSKGGRCVGLTTLPPSCADCL
jgi:hypothetical protein